MLLISILIISGCSKKTKDPLTGLDISDTIAKNTELTTEFYNTKNSGASTSELGDFVTTNIGELDEKHTSTLVTEIIKLGTLDKAFLSGKVYDFPNMTTVYATKFNYIWDIKKIDTLEDSDLKVFLDEIARSYYKISTHKNYIDVDIDYNRLSKFDNLSNELNAFIDINKTKRTLLLNASIQGEIDYKALRDNIINLESFLNVYTDSELLFEAESLYKSLISMYFIGSDGLNPFDYENKKFKNSFFDTILDTSINYPVTMLSDICTNFLNQIDNKNSFKSIDYVSLVSNYRKMGLKNRNTILPIVSEKSDNSNVIYPQFSSFEDKAIQDALNNKIQSEVESIKDNLNWKSDDNTKYNISYFVNYGSYKYISVQLSGSSYNRVSKENFTVQKNLNFNVNTGETIKLSELLDTTFNNYSEKLNELIKSSDDLDSSKLSSFDMLTKEPEFMISNLSIVLYFEKGEYGFDDKYPVYIYISQSELKDLLDFRELYK